MVNPYFVLTNRKRAVIALVHTVAFLLIAVRGVFTNVRALRGAGAAGWAMLSIYLVVGAILGVLAAKSRNVRERSYFAACTTSAVFGAFRQVLGDPQLHVAAYIRVLMLLTALVVGSFILREHDRAQAVAGS
jgi:hypothetical protein